MSEQENPTAAEPETNVTATPAVATPVASGVPSLLLSTIGCR